MNETVEREDNTQYTYLGNTSGDSGARLLSEALQSNTALTELNLRSDEKGEGKEKTRDKKMSSHEKKTELDNMEEL